MSVTLIIHFKARPEKRAGLQRILEEASLTLPGTEGCQTMDVLVDLDDPAAIVLVERWTSRDSHRAHFDAIVRSGAWDGILGHLAGEPHSAYYAEVQASSHA